MSGIKVERELKTELVNPEAGFRGKIIHSSGKISEVTLIESLIMFICSLFHVESPYHNIQTAKKVEGSIRDIINQLEDVQKNSLKNNFAAIEEDFVEHGSASQQEIQEVFLRIKQLLNGGVYIPEQQGAHIPEQPSFEDLLEKYILAPGKLSSSNLSKLENLKKNYEKKSNPNEAKVSLSDVRKELNKLGIEILKLTYGEKIVCQVLGSFKCSQIEAGEDLLDLGSKGKASNSLVFKLNGAKEKDVRDHNNAICRTMRERYGQDLLAEAINKLALNEKLKSEYVNEAKLETTCMAISQERVERRVKEFNYLNQTIFTKDFIDSVKKTLPNKEQEEFDRGKKTVSIESVNKMVMDKIQLEKTVEGCVILTRTIFEKNSADLMVKQALGALGISVSIEKAKTLTTASDVSKLLNAVSTLDIMDQFQGRVEQNDPLNVIQSQAQEAFKGAVNNALIDNQRS